MILIVLLKRILNVNVYFSFRRWVNESDEEMEDRKSCPICKKALDEYDKGRPCEELINISIQIIHFLKSDSIESKQATLQASLFASDRSSPCCQRLKEWLELLWQKYSSTS